MPQTPAGLPPKAALSHEFTEEPCDMPFPNGTEVKAMSSARLPPETCGDPPEWSGCQSCRLAMRRSSRRQALHTTDFSWWNWVSRALCKQTSVRHAGWGHCGTSLGL